MASGHKHLRRSRDKPGSHRNPADIPVGTATDAIGAVLRGATPMELGLGLLDLRYVALRTRSAQRERRVLASIAQVGQQMSIGVVRKTGGAHVEVDGYKRVRALRHDNGVALGVSGRPEART